MKYSSIVEYVKGLSVSPDTSVRTTCPVCGDRTFSVTRTLGKVKFQCFRASCPSKGVIDTAATGQELKERLRDKAEYFGPVPFVIPDHWRFCSESEACKQFLHKYNITKAYSHRTFRAAFDPIENRIVFLIMHEAKCYGAVGRALDDSTKPKARNYHETQYYPFVCGDKSEAVLVEDCTSAVKISDYYTGIALCGTNLHDEFISSISAYKTIIVALDNDAKTKSHEIASRIRQYTNAKVRFISKDIKDMNETELNQFLREVS